MKHIVSLVLLAVLGCGQPATQTSKATVTTAGPRFDIESIREDVRKPFADPEQLWHALELLNSADPPKTPLDAETAKGLREKLNFTEADVNALNRPEFGPLDGHVLHQAIFFLYAADTLEVKTAPPMARATAALEWVVRHVMIEETNGPPDPPEWSPRRGRGTGLERIYVYTALCQALGLEAFAIGDAAAASDVSKLWGVGIIDGADIRVFDPRLGISLPGTKKEVATLTSLQKDSATLQPLWALNYDVTAERVKAARLFPAVSLTSLAPRWDRLKSIAPPGTRAGIDARLLVEQAARHSLAGFDTQTTGTPLRLLAECLPQDQGGTDRPLLNQPTRKALFENSVLPWHLLPRELQSPVAQSLQQVFGQWSAADQIPGITEAIRKQQQLMDSARTLMAQEKEAPNDPRLAGDLTRMFAGGLRGLAGGDQGPTLQQLILRGKYDEATNAMIVLGGQFRTILQTTNVAKLEPVAKEWAVKMQAALVERDRAARAGNPAALEKAETTLRELSAESKKALAYVLALASQSSQARLSYLGTLAKHDQTEAKARRDRNPAVWSAAVLAWTTFLANHPNAPEAVSARRLLADALEGEGKKAAAAAAYRNAAAGAKNAFDRIACGYLAMVNE